ncbi:patatin-like phospholipase family protein [Luteimonas sp. SX5]|uniref:Patatin-like phospholipase family protein n=1 Tax=Luteimonas galliterrae TaxID=2940486 RepID=A0ABT0MJ58_9GAMM|nr:patatin-like phospholipase family protein [Luteimonas galliterrae]MCL1634899.1 patatin-like phospholipase family protein [Luteimonas galliterrae]
MAAAEAPKIRRGEPVALALGAGGARGLAQIGVIEALEARGMEIVTVAGSSSGALVGGIFAAGKLHEYRERLVAMDRGDFIRLLDPALGGNGLFRGERLIDAMREVVGDPLIETLPIGYVAVAVDLLRQREVWLRQGPLWQAIRASFAIPGLFTPAEVHGRELVDGGLLAPLPIAATRLSDAHRLIAVDMHGWPEKPPGQPAVAADAPARENRFTAWVERHLRRRMREEQGEEIGLSEIMARSLDTMQAQIARIQLALDPPELVIRIPRDACLFYEFWRAGEMIELGRIEAEKALDAAGY